MSIKYQLLTSYNELSEVTKEAFEIIKETDLRNHGDCYIHLSNDKEIFTLIPFANVRIGISNKINFQYANTQPN